MRKNLFYKLLGLGLIVLCADFFSKAYVYAHFPLIHHTYNGYPYGGVGIFQGFFGIDFSINYAANKGAAWGFFSSYQEYLLYFRILVIAALFVYAYFFNKERKKFLPFTLILAGAIGNVIDFFLYGHVVDMFYFKFGNYSYPIFNIADSAIFCGTLWLIMQSLFARDKTGSLKIL